MRNVLVILSVLFGLTALYAVDYWPERVYNGARSGRSTGDGNIAVPEVAWKLPMGGGFNDRTLLMEGSVYSSPAFVFVQGGHIFKKNGSGHLLWDAGNIGATSLAGRWDLNGDGQEELVVFGNNYQCYIVSASTGELFSELLPCGVPLKTIDIDNNGTLEIVTRNLWSVVGVRAYDFTDGLSNPKVAWTTAENLTNNGFELAFGDLDGDALTTELAIDINDYAKITVLDAKTGEVRRARTTPSVFGKFSYGPNLIVDVDGVAPAEFIFSGMVATYGNRGSLGISVYDYVTDSFKWQYEYGQNTGDVKVEFIPEAVADLDGDGLPEVAISVYNNTLELTRVNNKQVPAEKDGINEPNRWVTAVYRAADGILKGYITDAYIQTVADLTGDGIPELVVKRTVAGNSTIPVYGEIMAYRLMPDGALTQVWSASNLSLLECSRETKSSIDDYRAHKQSCLKDMDGNGSSDLIAVRDNNNDGKPEEVVALSAATDIPFVSRITALSNDEEALVVKVETGAVCLSRNSGVVQCVDLSGSSPTVIVSIPANNHTGSAVVFPHKGSARLLTTDARKRLSLWNPSAANPLTAPTMLWSLSNTVNQELFSVQPTAGGSYNILRNTLTSLGAPRIEFRSATGALVWGKDFPGAVIQPNSFVSGNFGGGTSRDIAAFIDFGGNHPTVLAFEATNGNSLMNFENPDTSRYQKATLVTVPNAVGLDTLFVISEGTGEVLDPATSTRLTTLTLGRLNRNGFSADLDGNGVYDLFGNQSFDQKRILRPDNSVLWEFPFSAGSSYYNYYMNHAGLADIDTNPGLDVALGGQYGDLSAYSGLDGTALWKRCLYLGMAIDLPVDSFLTRTDCPGSKLSNIASGDIDGDGLEEFVVGSPDGYLYVVNTEDGSLAWSYLFDYAVGNPILADVDNDGKIEVVVGVADGYLYAIDQKKYTAPIPAREAVIKNGKIQNPNTDIDAQSYAGQIGVAWSPVFKAKGYDVRIVNSSGAAITDVVTVTNGFQAIITDADIVSGQTYYAEVRGYDAKGYYSDWSHGDGVTVNVPAAATVLSRIRSFFR